MAITGFSSEAAPASERRAEAVPDLLRVARTTTHNGRTAAARALQRIGTPETGKALRMIEAELGSEWRWLFRASDVRLGSPSAWR